MRIFPFPTYKYIALAMVLLIFIFGIIEVFVQDKIDQPFTNFYERMEPEGVRPPSEKFSYRRI